MYLSTSSIFRMPAFAYACGQCFLEIAIHELISEKVVGSSLNYYNIVEVEGMLEANEFHLFGNCKNYTLLPLIFRTWRTMATRKNIYSEGKYSYALFEVKVFDLWGASIDNP